jgi:dephospho-CoA kinase
MKWIGLTGGIASGKSTVSQKLKESSIPVIDADEIAKDVVKKGSPGLKAIIEKFGADVLLPDGSLDRRKLGQKVFGNKELRSALEAITHPLVRAEVERRRRDLEEKNIPVAVYDIPLLFEVQCEDQFDAIIVVSCSPEQQRERLNQRSQSEGLPLDENEIEKRISSQIPLKQKEQKASFVVMNDGDQAKLTSEISRLLKWLNSLTS